MTKGKSTYTGEASSPPDHYHTFALIHVVGHLGVLKSAFRPYNLLKSTHEMVEYVSGDKSGAKLARKSYRRGSLQYWLVVVDV
jgi:hypothetical protein